MTTRKIMELTEADEPISKATIGHGSCLQRGWRSREPARPVMKTFTSEFTLYRERRRRAEILALRALYRLDKRVI